MLGLGVSALGERKTSHWLGEGCFLLLYGRRFCRKVYGHLFMFNVFFLLFSIKLVILFCARLMYSLLVS